MNHRHPAPEMATAHPTRCCPAGTSPRTSFARQRGISAVLLLFLIGGAAALAAYTTESTRLSSNAAQLKRATDAAALALANDASNDGTTATQRQELASRYVSANLGMDSELARQLQRIDVEESRDGDQRTFRVSASFEARPLLLGGASREVVVQSAAQAQHPRTEVALIIDSTMALKTVADLRAQAEAAKYFVDQLFTASQGSGPDDERGGLWMSVIPFAQEVNVYDPDDDRIHRWTSRAALRPTYHEALNFFRDMWQAGYRDLSDRRIPNRRAERLGLFRGRGPHERMFWDNPPTQPTFQIVYDPISTALAELSKPIPSSRRYYAISFQQTTNGGGIGSHTWETDWDIPNATLLPLEASRQKIHERIDSIDGGSQSVIPNAMGWAGSTLSPSWRGSAGWGDDELPLDYDPDAKGGRYKSIVMFFKWSDHINDSLGNLWNYGASGTKADTLTRYQELCRDFDARGIKVYAVVHDISSGGIANDQWSHINALTNWLPACTGNGERMQVVSGPAFVDSAKSAFKSIADEIKREQRPPRLIE